MEVLNTKRIIRLGILMAIFAMGLTGCSGIRVNQGISPATILLPGLLGEHDPTEAAPLVAGHSR
jgi:hypothetical protein